MPESKFSLAETPADIFEIATGFMKAKYLFVADEIGLFEALVGGPATLDELAPRLDVPRRTLRILADALITLGLLTRHGDSYQNSPAAQGFLGGGSPLDLRPFLLVDFWTDKLHTDPPFAAVMAGEFQLFYGRGDVYSAEEVSG